MLLLGALEGEEEGWGGEGVDGAEGQGMDCESDWNIWGQ